VCGELLIFKQNQQFATDSCNLPEWLAAAPDWLGMPFA